MPGSTSRSIRSRAVSLPRERCRSTAFSPPPLRDLRRALAQLGDERLHPLGAAREVSSRSTCEVRSATPMSLTNDPAGADKPGVRRDSFTFLLVGGGFIAIVPPALIHFVSPEHVLLSSKTHFWAVVASSLLATAAGVALSYGGWRRGDARAVLVGTAFTVMASLLLVHGLASPGFIVEMNGVVS